MGIYLNPGNEGFQSALRSQIYVDKTGILEYTNSVLDSEQRYICVSRPRRFGKSMTAEMLAGDFCAVNPAKFQNDMTSFKSKDDILTLPVHLGYLSYDTECQKVFIPNEEVRSEFVNAIEDAGWEYVMDVIRVFDELLKATWDMDEQVVAKGIESVHQANASILTYNNENSLSCIITLAYYNAVKEYTLVREMPSGKGYADIIFLPRRHSDKPAMVVELKWDQSAEGAIAQIKERKYMKVIEEYKDNILLVGIDYNKDTKEHRCRIERA